jgi:Immunity protein Imm1
VLARLFGASDRDIEPCFWLAKAGEVAALTFLDGAWSEYRASDPAYPVQATADQQMALSCGEPTPAPPEVCLQSARALQAAIEYLQSGERPSWLTYRYVR